MPLHTLLSNVNAFVESGVHNSPETQQLLDHIRGAMPAEDLREAMEKEAQAKSRAANPQQGSAAWNVLRKRKEEERRAMRVAAYAKLAGEGSGYTCFLSQLVSASEHPALGLS